MYTHIKELVPPERAASAMTGINFFVMIGGAAFLQGLGNFMQYFYPQASLGLSAFRGAFLFCTACLALTVVLYLFTVETRGKRKR